MANWGRRVNLLTWIALVFALVSWVIGLSGLAALSRIYQDPSNAEELQWWIIWFQLGALFAASLVQYKEWFGARGVIMGLMCVLTAMLMTQTNVANTQRRAAAISAFPNDTPRGPQQQQTQDIAAAMANQINNARGSAQQQQQQQQLPQLPPELLQGLSGIISGLDSSIAAKAAGTSQNASSGSSSSTSVPAPSSAAPTPGGSLGTAGMSAGTSSPLLGGDSSGDPRGAAAVIGGTRNGGGGNGGGPGGSTLGDPRQQPGGPVGTQPSAGGSMGGSQPAGSGVGGGSGRRRLLATGMETVQRRVNVVFLGLLGLVLADLALLVLFGVQHPHSKERSPRLYISSAVDQQPPVQYKDGAVEGVTLQVTAMPMRQGLRPENRAASGGVSLRFDGPKAASASVLPMRQPSRQLSGSFPFNLAERMESRHGARESPLREAKVTRLGSRQMSDAGLLGIRLEGTPQCHLPLAPITRRQSLERT